MGLVSDCRGSTSGGDQRAPQHAQCQVEIGGGAASLLRPKDHYWNLESSKDADRHLSKFNDCVRTTHVYKRGRSIKSVLHFSIQIMGQNV